MAVDKLVDSTQLDADLASVADAIRAKGGTSAQLAFPAEFVSAIEDIETGGGGINYLDYCTMIRFGNRFPTTDPNITLAIATTGEEMFNNATKYETVAVTFLAKPTNFYGFLGGNNSKSALKSITINGDFSSVIRWSDFVKSCPVLTEIKGTPLNFTAVTNANYTTWSGNSSYQLPALTYVRYAENTLKINQAVWAPNLDNASLVSIANGLVAGAHTLTLTTGSKDKLPNIVGTVTNNGTYDVFTEDAQGQTTLQDFITTTKGWTIA